MNDDGFFKVLVWLCVGGCIVMLAATKGCSSSEDRGTVGSVEGRGTINGDG